MEDSEPPESLWQTIKGDFGRATGLRILGVTGMLAWMAFQWGWGNDILLPPIVANAFEAVDDGRTWSSALAATAAGTGAGSLFWTLTQTFDCVIVLGGLRLVPGLTERISSFLNQKGWIRPYNELSLGPKFLIAYASGASVLCLVDVFATGRQGLRSRFGLIAEAVTLSVVGVGIAVAFVTSVAAIGARVSATANASEILVRYAKNPLTWLAIYGTVVGLSALLSRFGDAQSDPASAS